MTVRYGRIPKKKYYTPYGTVPYFKKKTTGTMVPYGTGKFFLNFMSPTYGSLALNGIHFLPIYVENGCYCGSTHPFFTIFGSDYSSWRALSPEYMVSVEIICM